MRLPPRNDNQRSEERSQGAAGIPADLEKRSREPASRPCGHISNAGGLGMKHGGTRSNESGGNKDRREAAGEGKRDEASQRKTHPESERVWHRTPIGVDA